MSKILLDTGILMRFLRGQRQAKELFTTLDLQDNLLLISGITALELYIGCRPGTGDLDEVERLIDHLQVVEIDIPVSKKAAILIKKYPSLFGSKISRGTADALILASAWEKEATLYTLNTRHFAAAEISEVDIHPLDQNAKVWV
ncbi:MAG: PIN domain-containing protein [candidate division NC10 bacterium]|nr:PIN domain-containing protein [candidate division NC10 bacterium]